MGINFEYPKVRYTWKNGWKIRVSIWRVWMCHNDDCFDDFKTRRLLKKHIKECNKRV